MSESKRTPSGRFVSLRLRLTAGATVLLTLLLLGLGYWFIDFAVQQAYNRITQALNDTLEGAANGPTPIVLKGGAKDGSDLVVAGEFGDDLAELHKLVPAFKDGVDYDSPEYQQQIAFIKDNPLYQKQLAWLSTLQEIEPHGYAYTFVPGPKDHPWIFIADVWSLKPDPADRARASEFGQYYATDFHPELLDAAFEKLSLFTITDDTELATNPFPPAGSLYDGSGLVQNPGQYFRNYDFAHPGNLLKYTDDWGTWVSGYAPIINSKGEVVGGVGVDFEAQYVIDVRNNIVETMGIAFVVIWLVVIALVIVTAWAFTGPIISLTKTAEYIGEGNYEQDLTPLAVRRFPDEISTLAGVFDIMVDKVAQRERNLRQQVEELKIMVDQSKRDAQVSEIVDSDFFQDLTAKAKKLRERPMGAHPSEGEEKPEETAKGKKSK